MPVDYSGKRIEMYMVVGFACAATWIFLLVDFLLGSSGPLYEVWQEVGGVNFYIIVFTLLSSIYFIWTWQKMLRFRVEFHELMDTTSKAKFLRSLDRIEYLAWKLGEDAHNEVHEKREAFRIKRRK